ncbi:MAG: hypothetical protein ACF8MF_04955 [Phycisphaerales bacterium JB052]
MNPILIAVIVVLNLCIATVRVRKPHRTPKRIGPKAMHWRVVLIPWWTTLLVRGVVFYLLFLRVVQDDGYTGTDEVTAFGIALGLTAFPMLMSFRSEEHTLPDRRDQASRLMWWNSYDRSGRHAMYRKMRLASDSRCVATVLNMLLAVWIFHRHPEWLEDLTEDRRHYATVFSFLIRMVPVAAIAWLVAWLRWDTKLVSDPLPLEEPLVWESPDETTTTGLTPVDEARRRLNR